jgi:hypothetical protein
VIWFTLGNISVVGTYYTHGLNLTPRGLLAAAAAAAAAYAAVASCTVPYSFSRWVSYSCGGLSLSNILAAYLISSLQLASFTARSPILAASSKLYSSQLLPAGAARSSIYSQDLPSKSL